jgi:hypothetical protein
LGAVQNTAVYRAVTDDERPYFLKLRQGGFDDTSVALPEFLSDQGIRQIIPRLATSDGQLWVSLDAFRFFLYPFTDGHNGYEVDLSDRHWVNFVEALKRLQNIAVKCEQLFLGSEGGEDREQTLRYLASNFIPDGVIEIACKPDNLLRCGFAVNWRKEKSKK